MMYVSDDVEWNDPIEEKISCWVLLNLLNSCEFYDSWHSDSDILLNTCEWNSNHIIHIYGPIWVTFGTEHLHIMLFSIMSFV